MSVNTFFDHIYCLNLDKRKDRWRRCEIIFDEFGIENVERFSATDGTELGSYPDVNRGQAGVIDSHRRILEDAMQKNWHSILILEDDIEFHQDFLPLFTCVEQEIPEQWSMLYLGSNTKLWSQPQVTEHLYLAGGALALHCLGISWQMFPILLEHNSFRRPLDMAYMAFNSGPDSFLVKPRLAYQRADWSDINEHYADYSFLKDD